MKRRRWILGLALAATLGAVWWVSGMDDDTDTSAATHRPRGASANRTATGARPATHRTTSRERTPDASAQSRLLAELTQRQHPHEPLPELIHNPFAAASFDPPPPKVEAPKPSAPPLRYKFIGKLAEGKDYTVFLNDGDNMVIAHQGDTLNDTYRVKAITENAIQFEYLPLNTVQTLSLQ
jgi:hypothetical protein